MSKYDDMKKDIDYWRDMASRYMKEIVTLNSKLMAITPLITFEVMNDGKLHTVEAHYVINDGVEIRVMKYTGDEGEEVARFNNVSYYKKTN